MRVAKLQHQYEEDRQSRLEWHIAAQERHREQHAEPRALPELPALLGALASPVRLFILGHVAIHRGDVTSIAQVSRVTLPTASRHLRILTSHSILVVMPRGCHHDYRLSKFIETSVVGRTLELCIHHATGQRLQLSLPLEGGATLP